jgi:hypothetical protein
MGHLAFCLLALNLAIAVFGILYASPLKHPRAARFFRCFLWLWIVAGALFCVACAFNPSTAIQLLTGTIIPLIQGIIPLAASATTILDPAESAAITAAQQIAMSGLNALKPVLQEYENNPNDTTLAAFQDAVNSVHDNLNGLLTAGQVKNVKTQQKITAIVNTAFQSLAGIESMILAKHPQTVAAAAAAKN